MWKVDYGATGFRRIACQTQQSGTRKLTLWQESELGAVHWNTVVVKSDDYCSQGLLIFGWGMNPLHYDDPWTL